MKTCLKDITNIFPREVQGNSELSFYWKKTGVGSLLFSCPSDNVTCTTLLQVGVLLRTLVLYYKQANTQANLLQLFPVDSSHTYSMYSLGPEFNFWFWFYCSMTLFSLCVKFVIEKIFMKASPSLMRLAKLS